VPFRRRWDWGMVMGGWVGDCRVVRQGKNSSRVFMGGEIDIYNVHSYQQSDSQR